MLENEKVSCKLWNVKKNLCKTYLLWLSSKQLTARKNEISCGTDSKQLWLAFKLNTFERHVKLVGNSISLLWAKSIDSNMSKLPMSSWISLSSLWFKSRLRRFFKLKKLMGRNVSLLWLKFNFVRFSNSPISSGSKEILLSCRSRTFKETDKFLILGETLDIWLEANISLDKSILSHQRSSSILSMKSPFLESFSSGSFNVHIFLGMTLRPLPDKFRLPVCLDCFKMAGWMASSMVSSSSSSSWSECWTRAWNVNDKYKYNCFKNGPISFYHCNSRWR